MSEPRKCALVAPAPPTDREGKTLRLLKLDSVKEGERNPKDYVGYDLAWGRHVEVCEGDVLVGWGLTRERERDQVEAEVWVVIWEYLTVRVAVCRGWDWPHVLAPDVRRYLALDSRQRQVEALGDAIAQMSEEDAAPAIPDHLARIRAAASEEWVRDDREVYSPFSHLWIPVTDFFQPTRFRQHCRSALSRWEREWDAAQAIHRERLEGLRVALALLTGPPQAPRLPQAVRACMPDGGVVHVGELPDQPAELTVGGVRYLPVDPPGRV